MNMVGDPDKTLADLKNTGIDWLGHIPAQWNVLPLRRVTSRVATGRTPPSTNKDYFTGGELNWFTPGDFSTGIELKESARKVTSEAVEDGVCTLFPKGTVFLVGIGATLGKVAVSTAAGSANQQINAILPDESTDSRYMAYFLHGFRTEVRVTSNGNTLGILNQDGTKSLLMPVPPLNTQQRIARFLDEKTAQIDALIEKKRALLERLAEKRQALITRAVTKGLNPDAPMKPSGIDWLGDIPAHWSLIPFKWRCKVQSGQVDPKEPGFAEMMLIAPDHIESGTGRLYEVSSAERQGAISGKYFCPSGTVLYSKIRPALRKVALYDDECLCSADMYAIDPGPALVREFLFYFLLTDAFTSYAELESLRVAMPKVNREALGAFPLPVPDIPEQRHISEFCKKVDNEHKMATDKIKESIEHLNEYRSALITAAVTGQINELQ